jgi:hypothetical protein
MRRRTTPSDLPPDPQGTANLRPLRVVISSGAWRQLGLVPAGVFRRIKDEMEDFASGVAEGVLARAEGGMARFPFYFHIDEYSALCDVDPAERTLTLQEVARRLPREP